MEATKYRPANVIVLASLSQAAKESGTLNSSDGSFKIQAFASNRSVSIVWNDYGWENFFLEIQNYLL